METYFMKTNEQELAPPRILLMGPYGVGKTFLIGQADVLLKDSGKKGLYLFDFEKQNTLRANNFSVEFDYYFDKPGEVKGGGLKRFGDDFTKFEYNPNGFGGFAIDNLTPMIAEAMRYNISINPSKRHLGFMPSFQDQGIVIKLMENILPQLLAVSTHSVLICTAHLRELTSEKTGETTVLPFVPGKSLPYLIGGFFTEVWRVYAIRDQGTIVRCVQTVNDGRFGCKSQTVGMPEYAIAHEALKLCFQQAGIFKKDMGTIVPQSHPALVKELPDMQVDEATGELTETKSE